MSQADCDIGSCCQRGTHSRGDSLARNVARSIRRSLPFVLHRSQSRRHDRTFGTIPRAARESRTLIHESLASPNTDTFYKGPKTARETSFAQVYGRDLHEAYEACRRYRSYGEARDLERAWEIYYGVSLCVGCYLTGFLYRVLYAPGLQADREIFTSADNVGSAIHFSRTVEGTKSRAGRAR